MNITRPSIMEIDLNAFKHNIKEIRNYIGDSKEIMPIITANAYGTHINKRLDIINEFNIVAVAITNEAIELRHLGYNKEIFILNQPYIDELNKIIEYDITIGLSSKEFLNDLIKINKPIKVHLEIETGMNRTGININDLNNFINLIKQNPKIKVTGIYTHLSSADNDTNYTNKQLEIFKNALNITKETFNTIKYIHTSASNGLLNFKEDFTNLTRPGIIMYGYDSFEGVKNIINIKPVAKLKSKITFIKTVSENTSIGYNRSYTTTKPTKIATIPIGYADGLRRELSNKGHVIINNTIVPIIGKVCMDSFMADITTLENINIGDDVYIWDNNLITLEELSNNCNTINYEILSTISERVPRIFI